MYNERTLAGEFDLELRASLARAIHSSTLSREQIADALTKRVDRKITTAMLAAWTAPSRQEWHLPADCVPALCEILQDDLIQRHLLSPQLLRALELGESTKRIGTLLKEMLGDLPKLPAAKCEKIRKAKRP